MFLKQTDGFIQIKCKRKKEIGKSTDQKRCKKKNNNQSMNVTWTLIQTIKKSMTQLKEVEYDLFFNDIKKLLQVIFIFDNGIVVSFLKQCLSLRDTQ